MKAYLIGGPEDGHRFDCDNAQEYHVYKPDPQMRIKYPPDPVPVMTRLRTHVYHRYEITLPADGSRVALFLYDGEMLP